MNYTECLEYIHSFDKFGSKPGFERINKLLAALGNPEKSIKAFHIAGTNGKGSVSIMLQSILTEAGYKTGLYISPYVIEFRERIQIDGEYIPKEKLCRYVEMLKEIIEKGSGDYIPTEFELITAVMFCYFRDECVDYAVLEVGMGGRLDATNVIENPIVSVITKIDLDHTAILGDTLSKIAHEKCGIIKPGSPTVTTNFQEEETLAEIEKISSERGSKLYITSSKELKPEISKQGTYASVEGLKLSTPMIGHHQADNMYLALSAIKASGLEISEKAIIKGIERAKQPARTEVISNNPFVLLDGSHNPAGAEALAKALKGLGIRNSTAIIGMMKDKDVDEVINKVIGFFDNVITVTVAGNPRSISAEELAEICKGRCKNVFSVTSYEAAISLAGGLSEQNGLVVLGSLYLAGDIRASLIEYFN